MKINRMACTNDYEIKVDYNLADWDLGTYSDANPVDHFSFVRVSGCRYDGADTASTDAEWKTYFATTVSTDCVSGWESCDDWDCDSYDLQFS